MKKAGFNCHHLASHAESQAPTKLHAEKNCLKNNCTPCRSVSAGFRL